MRHTSIRQLWFREVLHVPKIIQVGISLGCPPELDDKILLLMIQHTLDVRYKETKDQHSVLLPFWPAFIMLQDVIQAGGREEAPMVICGCESYQCNPNYPD